MKNALRAVIALLVTLAATWIGAAPRDGVVVRLSAAVPVLRGDVDVKINVSVTNTNRHPVHLLRWQLPGDELSSPLFRITRDGQPVRYTGALVKRAGPEAADFVKLGAGETLSYEVELTADYALDRNGMYAIEYASRGAHGNAANLGSDTLYLWLEGRSAKGGAAAAPAPAAASLSYNRCTTSQQGLVQTAVGNAGIYANGASSYLGGNNGSKPRYTTWFGAPDAGRYNTVKGNFVAIADAFANKPITVDCSCRKKNVYAYVYANQPYTIYVCGAFWSAPATGTDSKAGTLVHEMSHFTVVAGTDDYAYGQTAAKNLALTNPAQAIDNADSHEYFAENTPTLP